MHGDTLTAVSGSPGRGFDCCDLHRRAADPDHGAGSFGPHVHR